MRNQTEPRIFTPSRTWINNLQIGDMAQDCFGNLKEVVSISYRGEDLKGKAYVGYYTKMGENSRVSHSAKEGEVQITVTLTGKYNTTYNIPKELIVESDTLS